MARLTKEQEEGAREKGDLSCQANTADVVTEEQGLLRHQPGPLRERENDPRANYQEQKAKQVEDQCSQDAAWCLP